MKDERYGGRAFYDQVKNFLGVRGSLGNLLASHISVNKISLADLAILILAVWIVLLNFYNAFSHCLNAA